LTKPILDRVFSDNFSEKEKDLRTEIDYMLAVFIPSLTIQEWQKRYLTNKIEILKELVRHLKITAETGEEQITSIIEMIPPDVRKQIKSQLNRSSAIT